MRRPLNYSTRQRVYILDYIRSLGNSHITAAQIVAHFQRENAGVGRTTIYRHLDKLTESGVLRRYTTDGVSGACYQYMGGHENCAAHFHLKCENCGELVHFECETLRDLQRHVQEKHAFKVNPLKTVFYGQCENCQRL